MAPLEDLPLELLIDILHLALHPDHPEALEHPLINWQSTTNILFRRARTQRTESLRTRASVSLVNRQWNEISTPWLYEHILIDSEAKLMTLVHMFKTSAARMMQLATLVKRLDIELPHPTSDPPYESLADLLPSFGNMITLVMMLHPPDDIPPLLHAIPVSLKHLLWSTYTPDGATDTLSSGRSLFNFFERHPQLETFSHPFFFDLQEVVDIAASEPRRSHPLPQNWVIRNLTQFWDFSDTIQSPRGLRQSITVRTMASSYQPHYIHMVNLLSGLDRTANLPISSLTQTSTAVTELSICVKLVSARWPPEVLSDDLHVIEELCPNLRIFNLTLIGEAGDSFSAPMEPTTAGIRPVPQVTIASLQRVFPESEISDPVGTLHYAIRVPWSAVFPNIQALRIREDIDLDAVAKHPTMAFAREADWAIRIEDRFGELVL